ncbi:MAG: NAD(P)/FAD-dependent oxidoreductase [Hyphomicrobiales bacterium]
MPLLPMTCFAPAPIPRRRPARPPARPRVVILGGGFAGLNAAKALAFAPVDVTVVDRRNYHLFQPLLYQVATAALSPGQIAAPIRQILAHQRNATVVMADVERIDLAKHEVVTDGPRLPFEFLIVATGASTTYFGHPDWETDAPGLKTIEEATAIRSRVLLAFEDAEREGRSNLAFVVIGAGPTGVEMAGAIAELARHSIVRDFRRIDTARARCILIEAGPRVLPAFPEDLSESARRQLVALGVEVKTGRTVIAIDDEGLTLDGGERILSACTIWAAGVAASPAAQWLGVEPDRGGRVRVLPDLSLPGHPDVFVTGDAALAMSDGKPVPGVAPAAVQMGLHAARMIERRLALLKPEAFRYKEKGTLATIGRRAAVADLGPRLHFSGFAAWLLWSIVHLWGLVGFRNRITVFVDWAWAYLTHQRGVRLITARSEIGARALPTALSKLQSGR